jgi:hypothetical protein
MPTSITARLRDNYALVAKDLIAPLIEVLNSGRRTCGDLESFTIILVVALRTAEDRRVAGLKLDEVLTGDMETWPSLSTNVRSIADSTGIPKETVRRKVAALVEAGWIQRDNHSLALTTYASRMLTEVREPVFELAARYYQTVQSVQET